MKLSVPELNSHYGRARMLFDVSLEVGAGEAVALIGRNGAGKSTTMRAILGLVKHRSGEAFFRGRDISAGRPIKSCAAGSAMCPKIGASFPI